MTKADRERYDYLIKQVDYWAGLSIRNAVDMKVMTKREGLASLEKMVSMG